MKNLLLLICILLATVDATAQQAKLSGTFDPENRVVKLNWNMMNSSSKSAFVLLRSTDGNVWTEAAKDRITRNYTDQDVYSFDDKFYTAGKNFYRLRIMDGSNNTIALSPVITVNTTQAYSQSATATSGWMIYPNPVSDVLTLSYKGSENIPGVVNIQVQDITGKIVIKFRSASINKNIQIPVSKLKTGIYIVQVSVLNELVLNQKIMKQ